MSGNEIKYKDIMSKKLAQPNVPLTKLCSDQGISYQSYNNWFKKHSKAATAPRHALKVTLRVSVAEVASAIGQGVTEVPLSIDRLISALDLDEQKQLAEELGRQQLEAITQRLRGGRDPEPKPGEGPMPLHSN